MAEAVVSFAVEKIGNLLFEEAEFLWGVEGKVEDLQRELRLIQCLLRDADARREQNHTLRECVAQLRDIVYDAEDVIERYVLRVAMKKGQNIIKAYACFVAECTFVRVHAVGIEIEGLKSRISDIGRRMQNYGIQFLKEGDRKQARALIPKRTYNHFQEYFVGREDGIQGLVKELLNDGKSHRVNFIWGMCGLGKTSLAKKVIAHDEVKKSFDGFAWICVSQEYDLKDILKDIRIQLDPSTSKDVRDMETSQLFATLYKIQQKKRCLVVLDDVSTKEAWDSLRAAFPVEDTGSKLLITTRNKEVAEHIDPKGHFHRPRYLSDQESWDLLKKWAFPEMKVITEDIDRSEYELLKRCGGLPSVIVELGRLMAIKGWETVYQKFNLHLSVSKVLALSYDDLPWYLKPCFLYLGMYPEDAEIPVTEILHMWIAEGFVSLNDVEDMEAQVEDVAEGYLKELIERGMIQPRFTLSGKIKTCRHLMRDTCISKARQENFLSIGKIQQDNHTEDCSSPMAIKVEATKVEATGRVRRLSLNVRVTDEQHMFPSLEPVERTMPDIRTFMFFGSVDREWKQCQPDFINCQSLKVLKLEGLCWTDRKLPESMGDLVQLRFLSLARSDFNELPQSMGKLVRMEFLDLHVVKNIVVPNVLWKMKRLRHLHLPASFDVKEEFAVVNRKLRLDTLKNLRRLKNFDMYECDEKDIHKLFNLRKLSIHYVGKPEMVPQLAELTLEHLQSITFCLSGSVIEGDLSKMSSYHYSCKLFIFDKIKKLPEHTSLPKQLTKLVLITSKLKEDPMPILENLHHLAVLVLGYDAFIGKEMVCSAGGFPQLKHLFLELLLNLEELGVAEGAMPRLSRLAISYCPKLNTSPHRGLPTYDCSEDAFRNWMKTLKRRMQ